MSFWIAISALTLATLAILLWPLLRRQRIEGTRADYDLTVYRDQLDEIERDLGRGLLNEDEANAAKREIRRRVIAAEVNDSIVGVAGKSPVLAVTVAAVIVTTGIVIYTQLGAPGVRDQPLAARAQQEKQTLAQGGDIPARIALLEQRLADDPNSFEQWWMLGRSYGFVKRYDKAAEAYRRAAELSGERPDVLSAYGEAVTLANGNRVNQTARLVFEQVRQTEPDDPRARYYLALYEAQHQRFDVAMQRWEELLADSPEGAPWVPMVRKGIADMARFLGEDVAAAETASPAGEQNTPANAEDVIAQLSARLAQNPKDYQGWLELARTHSATGDEAAARAALDRVSALYPSAPFVQTQIRQTAAELGLSPAESGGGRGPSQADIAAAGQMSEAERGEMVEAMVAGLAGRLEQQRNDLEGWLMLMRSYTVLGRTDQAREAARKALVAFEGAEEQQNVLRATIKELGIQAD